MNRKKFISIFLLCFTLFLSNSVSAQNYYIQNVLKACSTELELNDQQVMQLAEISYKYYPEAKNIQNMTGTNVEKYKKVMSIKKKLDADIKKILTVQQFKKYTAICNEQEKKIKASL